MQGDSLVASLTFKEKEKDKQTSKQWQEFLFWLQVEFLLFVTNIFANILIFMVRSCSKNHLQSKLDHKREKSFDTIERE